jgi:hypothetical protein
MNWKWGDLSTDAQKTMMGKCTVFLREGNGFDLSALLNAFQVMEYRWKENESMRESIFTGIVKNFGHGNTNMLSGRDVANVIYYLGQSEIEWKDLPKDVQNRLFSGISRCYSSFNGQDISNTIHG